MHRAKWTLVQWSSEKCRFIPKRRGDPLPPLVFRQRIPAIDKIEQEVIDDRAPKFNEALASSIPEAQSLLETWCDGLQVNTLGQYAYVFAHRTGKFHNIPEVVRHKLDRYGLLSRLKNSLRVRPSSRVLLPVSTCPLNTLANHPEIASDDIQEYIQNSSGFSKEIVKLQNRWSKELLIADSKSQLHSKEFSIIYKFLSPTELCNVVAKELALVVANATVVPFPKSLASFCRKLGNRIEEELLAAVAKSHENRLRGPYRRSEYLNSLVGRSPWSKKQRISLGARWVEVALRHCRFTQMHDSKELERPAFWKTWHLSGPSKRGVFIVNPFLIRKLHSQGCNENNQLITAEQIPSLVPLTPWSSTYANSDNPHVQDLSLITSASTEGQAAVSEAIRTEAALLQLQGLNRLQSQAWKINRRVLSVLKAINSREHFIFDSQESASHGRKITGRQQTHAIAIAESLGERRFYLPMYMDFRGRCYPSTKSILSFMGKESMRSLFQFADSRPLGPEGLRWLEIHLANLYGQCKSHTYEARRKWVAQNRANVTASAEDPQNVAWWQQSQKPFQTLAACFDLRSAWSHENPSEYLSSLPIQLDATSNGLQHLVALARDEINAPNVNMTSNERCNDVYTTASEIFSTRLGRNVIKKAVMTFFYGASTTQITNSLRAEGAYEGNEKIGQTPGHDEEQIHSDEWASRLVAMFAPERAVQRWLVDCTHRIMSVRRADQEFPGCALTWTTSLGLPVVQPYVEPKLMAVRTPLQSFFIQSEFHLPPVARRKQAAGVVANIVHSLDAAHMLATARKMPPDCSFAAIHDNFWTHAGTVPVLNRVLREEFVRLHERHVLEDLREEWMQRYDKYMVLASVHSDSPIYERLIWHRDGVSEGYKQRDILESELRDIYHDRDVIKPPPSRIKWVNNVPHIGTPGLPRVHMWVPLQLDPPPNPGTFNMKRVLDAPYFFS